MRKLKLQVQISVDGFVAGPNGEMDWLTFPWTEDIGNYVGAITEPVDTIILGRNLAEGFIPHWASVAADPNHPEQAAGQKFSDTAKVVFSRTLETTKWANTAVANGDLVTEINSLKQQDGGDIIAYGGVEFVSELIKHDLIDEYHLFVNTTAMGSGKPIFTGKTRLKLHKATPFACGIVALHYQPIRN
ncbi:MAG: dihydrofolate reductase family protein [Anaerolineales bacterium]|nr:dihydrofolate reductase family protein [Anaerolineales bacterium]